MKVRQDAWSHEDDVLLADTVLNHIKEGSTQLKAFDEVGDALNRTSAACGFRWNAVVRQKHLRTIEEAKRERKMRKRMVSTQFFPSYQKPVQTTVEPLYSYVEEDEKVEPSIEAIISQLKKFDSNASSSLKEENATLRQQLQLAKAQIAEMEKQLSRNKQEHSMIEEDYQSLISIMNRARRMAILEEDAEEHPMFRMETNGNLEKID
ncbi:RsfA family transcriptional regulator [Shouchella sp. 1P09AA]|uniref:RsfA family transcriptional regulator n=1 Tax=unclassified Shouchella TaxID=2893065 RepID=UPI00399FC8E4